MPEPTAPPHLLVLAPNWLGDAVMASPLLDLLHAARDAAGRRPRLTLAVRPAWEPLFRGDPRLDACVPVRREGRHGGPLGALRLGRDLAAADPDAVILGPPSLRAAVAARVSGAPVRVGYRADGRAPLLSHALPRPPRGAVHHAEELRRLGVAALDACGLRADGSAAGALLPGAAALPAAEAGAGPELWALAPGTTYGEAKTWPVGQVAAFLARAVRTSGVRVALLGDAAARGFVEVLAARTADLPWRRTLPGAAGVVDLVGATDLAGAVGVLKAATAFVGNDSGLMHVAGALGLPTVGIFGSSNPDWTHPLGPRTRAVVADGFPCRPCYRRRCNQPVFCLEQVEAAAVHDALVALRGGAAEATT